MCTHAHKRCKYITAYSTANMVRLFDIDWFVWEPIDSAHVYNTESLEPMTAEDLESDAGIKGENGRAFIIMPVGRFCAHKELIRINAPCTVKQLLEHVYDFYNTPIVSMDYVAQMDDDGCGYWSRAMEKLGKGDSVRMVDLNGLSDYGGIVDVEGGRRHCLIHCNGSVRFEGLEQVQQDLYELRLGS